MTAAPIQTNDVTARIRREITSDPRVTGITLEALEQDGSITLTGTVGSFAAKLYAEQAARRAVENGPINNKLEVKIPRHEYRADKEIADAVRYTFKWNVLLPTNSVDCVVVDGWVLLTGKVSADYQKLEAEVSIYHVAGIRGIVNDIEISAPMD